MKLSLKSLHYFATASELGSISKAADRLHVVPSAVSAAIDQAEAEFTLKLVSRHRSKGIAPTAEGLALLPRVRRLLEDYDSLLGEGSELRGAISGEIKIGYYAPVAPAFLPRLLSPLLQENPGLSFRFEDCDSPGAQSGLLEGRYDIILFVAENVRQGIAYEALLEAPAYLLCGQKSPLAKRTSISPADLTGEAIVVLDLPIVGDYYRDVLDKAGLASQISATATSTEMVRSLVGAGFGSAILNMRPRTDVSYGGDTLACVPMDPQPRPLRLLLGHHTGQKRRSVELVINACREAFASERVSDLVV